MDLCIKTRNVGFQEALAFLEPQVDTVSYSRDN